MRLLKRAAALLLFISFFSSTLIAQKHGKASLPKPVGVVNDFERILSANQEKYLDSMIKAYEKKTTVQIALITIDTSMISRDKFENYVYRIANDWGVGQKEKNNGVTIGLSKGYRFMRIETGYGIRNILTDNETKKIIDEAFIPYFKKGQYFEGIVNGLEAIMKKIPKL
jgi:uncharacterized protein